MDAHQMNLGIIGLPQVGKKTIFRILTGIDPAKAQSHGQIRFAAAAVKDPRVDQLTQMYNPKRTKYAEFEIVLPPDIQPNNTKGAEWLEPLRKTDALLHVVRGFPGEHVFHIQGGVDPARDLETVDVELLIADLELAEKRLDRMEKERHKPNAASREKETHLLQRCQQQLEAEQPLRLLELSPEERTLIRSLQFLTLKPMVVVFNVSEDTAAAEKALAGLIAPLREKNAQVVFLSAAIEGELSELEAEEQRAFMEDLGIEEPASHRLSRAAFDCLGLLSFFTVGPDEVRAWSVAAGAKAPEAAGKIHSDLERGFIRAETIHYDELIAAGSEKQAKQDNLFRLNGKDYVVKDGDILNIRFNV